MTIAQLLDVYDGHIVVKASTEHSTRLVVDTRKTEGNIPFDLMDKKIYNAYIDTSDFYANDAALTIYYEEV